MECGDPSNRRPAWLADREYLLKQIANHSVVDTVTGCWIWRRATSNGYGELWVPAEHRPAATHRLAYELLIGPIPDGLHLDHEVCDRRACCNPPHLVPKSSWANTSRSERNPLAIKAKAARCMHGHEFTEANIYRHPTRGHRHCRTCAAMRPKAGHPRNRLSQNRRQGDRPAHQGRTPDSSVPKKDVMPNRGRVVALFMAHHASSPHGFASHYSTRLPSDWGAGHGPSRNTHGAPGPMGSEQFEQFSEMHRQQLGYRDPWGRPGSQPL